VSLFEPTTEIYVDGDWEDISEYVRYEGGVTISRGRADRQSALSPSTMNLQLNNTDGRFSPRNPTGPYYGQLGRNTRIRQRVGDAVDSYVSLNGVTFESFVSTPDAAALDITGDIDIRVDIDPDTWSAVDDMPLVSKWAAPSNLSWSLDLRPTNVIRFSWTTGGTDATVQLRESASIGVTSGRQALRVTLDVNNGAAGHDVRFYTADTIDGSWTQLGSTSTTAGTTSIFSGTSPVEVGAANDGQTTYATDIVYVGKIYAAQVYQGIAGTLRADADFRSLDPDQASTEREFTDSEANVWTIHEGAAIRNDAYRFHGEVPAWPPRWADETGNLIWTPIEAAGITRRLTTGEKALHSPIRRHLSALAPTGYWPLEDGSGSTSAASAVAENPAAAVSDVAFAFEDTLPGSVTCVQMATSVSTVAGIVRRALPGGATGFTYLWFFKLNGLPGSKGRIMEIACTGTVARWVFSSSATDFYYDGYDVDEVLVESGNAVHVVDPLEWVAMSFRTEDIGATVDVDFTWTQIGLPEEEALFYTVAGNYSGSTGPVKSFNASGGGLMRIAHILAADNTFDFVTWDFVNSANGWTGEGAVERMARLCSEENVALGVDGRSGWSDDQAMGQQEAATLMDLLTECEQVDGGILFEPRDAFGLAYRPRSVLYEQTGPTLDYEQGHIAAPFEPVDDDREVRNDVTVSRPSGSSARRTVDEGPLSTLPPPDGVGTYTEDVTLNVYTDDQLPDQAGWLAHLGTWDEVRFPSVTVNLAASAYTSDPDLHADAAGLDIGDLVTVDGLPVWMPPDPVAELVRGTTETITEHQWAISYTATPGGPYTHVGTLTEDAGDLRGDFTGATLDDPMDTTDTSLPLAVETGHPLATTVSGDMPYDVLVGGERMTVTAASGTSSPQTLTVTRSVNGVVKEHDAGAPVQLFDPVFAAL